MDHDIFDTRISLCMLLSCWGKVCSTCQTKNFTGCTWQLEYYPGNLFSLCLYDSYIAWPHHIPETIALRITHKYWTLYLSYWQHFEEFGWHFVLLHISKYLTGEWLSAKPLALPITFRMVWDSPLGICNFAYPTDCISQISEALCFVAYFRVLNHKAVCLV